MYADLCAQFYDMDKPEPPLLAFEWFRDALLDHLRDWQGESREVLEPMCGSGRFLGPMIASGLVVHGTDNSEPMLERCREISGGKYQPFLYLQSMQELDLPGKYAAAFIPASSFCLLHELKDARLSLRQLHAQLDPGALVLIEFEVPHKEITWSDQSEKTLTKGGTQMRLVSRTTYDFDTQLETSLNSYELKKSGKLVATEEETITLRCYTPEQMTTELVQAGFCDVQIQHQDFGWVARAYA